MPGPTTALGLATAGLTAALCLTGCTPAPVAACENALKDKLKAPSTYKRVDYTFFRNDGAKPPEASVSIDYDADNSYGAPLRDHEYCTYALDRSGDIDWAATKRKQDAAEAEVNAQVEKDLKELEPKPEPTATVTPAKDAVNQLPTGPDRFPYVAPDGVDIRNAADEAN